MLMAAHSIPKGQQQRKHDAVYLHQLMTLSKYKSGQHMDMGLVHGHGASTWTWGQYMDMGKVHGHQASTWTWGMYMDIRPVHGHGASIWTWGKYMGTLQHMDIWTRHGHGASGWTRGLDMYSGHGARTQQPSQGRRFEFVLST